MRTFAIVSFIGILGCLSASAQEGPRFTFDVGGGFTTPAGNTGRQLDTGWNVGAGVGFNFSSVVGAKIDLGFSSMGINSNTLANIGVPGGDVRVFSATVDPVVHLTPHHHVDLYLTGGGGLFHIYQQFTQPAVGVTNAFDPFFGLYPVAFPATEILSSYSVNKPGFDVGGGMAIGALGHGKLFMEAKWEHAFLTNSHVDYLPVSFGFRW
jgi:opacity protein-like surface antigen